MNPKNTNNQNRSIALFLSGLVLPGLGQIHLGHKKKGWAMVLLTLSTLIIAFAKYMMGVFKIVESHRYPRPPSLQILKTLLESYRLEKTWILCGFGLIVLIWLWSVVDVGRMRKD
jgi:hypothetical protein